MTLNIHIVTTYSVKSLKHSICTLNEADRLRGRGVRVDYF
jgi:hypothetical protein